MAVILTLREEDVPRLAKMLHWFETVGRNIQSPSRRPNSDEILAPEVFVAKSPIGGIPAISGVTPGYADCNVWRMTIGSSGYPTDLEQQTDFTKRVYNFSSSAIAADSLVLIQRDKFGHWYVVSGGGTSDPSGCLSDITDYTTMHGYDSTAAYQVLATNPHMSGTGGPCFQLISVQECNPAVLTVPYADPLPFDFTSTPAQTTILTGSPGTVNFTNVPPGKPVHVAFVQNGTGGYTPTTFTSEGGGGTITWAGGAAPTFNTGANQTTLIKLIAFSSGNLLALKEV